MFADHGWPWHQCSHQPRRRHSHFFVVNSNFFWIRLWSRSPFFLVAATQFLFLYPMTVYVSICLFVCLSLSIPRYLHTHTHTHFTHVSWLVVWNIWTFFPFHKNGNVIIPTDFFLYFSEGWLNFSTTNQSPPVAPGFRQALGSASMALLALAVWGGAVCFFWELSIYLWLSM